MVHKHSDISVINGNVQPSLFKEIYPFVLASQPEAALQVYMCVQGEGQQEHRAQILSWGKGLLQKWVWSDALVFRQLEPQGSWHSRQTGVRRFVSKRPKRSQGSSQAGQATMLVAQLDSHKHLLGRVGVLTFSWLHGSEFVSAGKIHKHIRLMRKTWETEIVTVAPFLNIFASTNIWFESSNWYP